MLNAQNMYYFIIYLVLLVLATSNTDEKIDLAVGDIVDILKTYSDTIHRITTVSMRPEVIVKFYCKHAACPH